MVLVLIGLMAAFQAAPTGEPRIERLDSGLRVVVVTDHTLPLASVQVWYRSGSAYDDPRNPGLCHVCRSILEHRDEAALRLRAAGVRFESRTLRDACYFSSVMPPNFLDYVLQIEAKRMRPFTATPVVVTEGLSAAARDYGRPPTMGPARDRLSPDWELREDGQILTTAGQRLLAALFADHPYRHPPGLVAESLKGLAPADVDEFMQRWFVPGNATLFVIGDVSDVEAMELARRHFGSLPWAEPVGRPNWPEPQHAEIELYEPEAQRTGVDFAWLTPSAGYADAVALDVLMQRLCNPVDGSLARRLEELGCPPPTWRRASWRLGGTTVLSVDSGEPQCHGTTEPQTSEAAAPGPRAATQPAASTDDIRRVVGEEFARAADQTCGEIELNRARALVGRDMRRRRTGFAERAFDFAWHESVAGDVLLADFEPLSLRGVGVRDVQRAVTELREARQVVRIRARDATARAAATPPPELVKPLGPGPPEMLDSAAALDLLAAQLDGAPPVLSPKSPASVTTKEVGEQVRVTIIAIPGLEPLEIRSFPRTRGGCSLAALTALTAVGSTRHSVDQIRDYLTYHGLELYALLSARGGMLACRTPATFLAQAVELQAELLRFPEHSEEALRRGAAAARRGLAWLESADEAFAYAPPGLIGCAANSWPPDEVRLLRDALETWDHIEGVDIVIAGQVDAREALTAVRSAWDGFRAVQAGADASAPQEPPPARVPEEPVRASPPVEVHWKAADQPCTYLEEWRSAPPLDAPLRRLAARCTEWTVGAPSDASAALGQNACWLWRSSCTPQSLTVWDIPGRNATAAEVGRALSRLEDLRLGRLPPEQVQVALRLARCDRLLALDSADRIADAFEPDEENPWDVGDPAAVDDFLKRLPRLVRVQRRTVLGLGPEDRSAELSRFACEPPAPTSAPASP